MSVTEDVRPTPKTNLRPARRLIGGEWGNSLF